MFGHGTDLFGSDLAPYPVSDLGHVFAMLPNTAGVFGKFVFDVTTETFGTRIKTGHPVESGPGQMEPIEPVEHNHIEGRCGRSLFAEPLNMQVLVVGSSASQLVDQRWVTVVGKGDRFIFCERGIERHIVEAMQMLAG